MNSSFETCKTCSLPLEGLARLLEIGLVLLLVARVRLDVAVLLAAVGVIVEAHLYKLQCTIYHYCHSYLRAPFCGRLAASRTPCNS